MIESVPLTEKEKVKYLYKEVPIIKEVHKFVEQPTFVRNNEFIIESIPMDKLDKVDKIKDKKLEDIIFIVVLDINLKWYTNIILYKK